MKHEETEVGKQIDKPEKLKFDKLEVKTPKKSKSMKKKAKK